MTKLRNGPRTPGAVLQAWEQRTHLVKQEMAAESAAMDAKTMRLRALRLEKERQDAEAAPEGAPEVADTAAKAKPQPRVKRIVVT